MIMKGLSNQRHYISVYYEKKLKFKLFNYLLYSNERFSEYSENAAFMMQKQRVRKLLMRLK